MSDLVLHAFGIAAVFILGVRAGIWLMDYCDELKRRIEEADHA